METFKAKQKIDLIAKYIFNNAKERKTETWNGLYAGEYGWLLFMSYYAKYSDSKKYTSLTENYAEILVVVRFPELCQTLIFPIFA